MNSHYADLNVTITNLGGAGTELDHVTEIITSALRSAGYKSTVTVDEYEPHRPAATDTFGQTPGEYRLSTTTHGAPEQATPTRPPGVPEAIQGCAEWRMANGRADVCPMPLCQRCRYLSRQEWPTI